jgi:alkanesulfonate monooxygenase SsuD/methylene tetrahydromethanopterin reductase-like flavin-dependent oxidoreductase (luciferase family)
LVERAEAVRAAREAAGASGPFGFGTFVPVGLGATPDDAWASIRDGVLHIRGSYALWAQNERDVSRAVDAAAPFEDQIRAASVVGTPAQVADEIGSVMRRIEALGFDEVFFSAILAPPGTALARAREAVDRFGSEVIPALS